MANGLQTGVDTEQNKVMTVVFVDSIKLYIVGTFVPVQMFSFDITVL